MKTAPQLASDFVFAVPSSHIDDNSSTTVLVGCESVDGRGKLFKFLASVDDPYLIYALSRMSAFELEARLAVCTKSISHMGGFRIDFDKFMNQSVGNFRSLTSILNGMEEADKKQL